MASPPIGAETAASEVIAIGLSRLLDRSANRSRGDHGRFVGRVRERSGAIRPDDDHVLAPNVEVARPPDLRFERETHVGPDRLVVRRPEPWFLVYVQANRVAEPLVH